MSSTTLISTHILAGALSLLGQAVRVNYLRGWAEFWCPFHNDAARAGSHGRPNFGVCLEDGHWKCLRCGVSGPSLESLGRKLGKQYSAPSDTCQIVKKPESQVCKLGEAINLCRVSLHRSPAYPFLIARGVREWAQATYGLGYGLPNPNVHLEAVQAGRSARLVTDKGFWMWAGSVVYADPPIKPTIVEVRRIALEDSEKYGKYRDWGHQVQPLGAWRISPATNLIVVVEGMFDMLVLAQALKERGAGGLYPQTIAVYTGGAAVKRSVLDWFCEHSTYDYVLLPDPDEAGEQWTSSLVKAIKKGNGNSHVIQVPGKTDPDEAILKGWWPSGL
jgi:hypothetical protein